MKILFAKYLPVVFLIQFLSLAAVSQKIAPADLKRLRATEDTLMFYAYYLTNDSLQENRMIADSVFTRRLVRTLQVKHSFYYPFDSLFGISKLYAPDSAFRIFTWNLEFNDYWSLKRGAIQMRTADGSLKLIGLHDASPFIENTEDSVRGRMNWIGAVYYNIVKTQYNGRNYYTLFGLDNGNAMITRKWIEVLTFDNNNQPVFGGPFFSYDQDSIRQKTRYRFSLEFKKNARVLANYIPDLGVILIDHLISEANEPEHKWTLVPDGDNEAFKWENGKWVHVDKAFDFKIDMSDADPYMGKPPVGEPILDAGGRKNEKKLEEKSNKNKTKEKRQINNDN